MIKICLRPAVCFFWLMLLILGGVHCRQTPADSEKQEVQEVTVGYGIYPPLYYQDEKGEATGEAITIWNKIACDHKLKVKFILESGSKLDRLEKGDFDALAGAFELPSRRHRFDFSKQIKEVQTMIYVRKDAAFAAETLTLGDLKGLGVGVVKEDSALELARDAHLNYKEYDNFLQLIRALEKEKGNAEAQEEAGVDAILADELVADYFIEKYCLCDKIHKKAAVDKNILAIPVKKGNKALLEKINATLSSPPVNKKGDPELPAPQEKDACPDKTKP